MADTDYRWCHFVKLRKTHCITARIASTTELRWSTFGMQSMKHLESNESASSSSLTWADASMRKMSENKLIQVEIRFWYPFTACRRPYVSSSSSVRRLHRFSIYCHGVCLCVECIIMPSRERTYPHTQRKRRDDVFQLNKFTWVVVCALPSPIWQRQT